MATLVELDGKKHSNLKVAHNCAVELAQKQHVINVKAVEVAQAASNFPVFLTRVKDAEGWAITAVTGLEVGKNLFVSDNKWSATYVPTSMQTYPFYLMKSPRDETQATIGIDEQNSVFSEAEGEALFDEKNKASLYLSRVTALLQADIKHDVHSFQFSKLLEELELIQAIDILVQYEDGKVNTLTGLNTLNEDKLQALNAEQLSELRDKHYLAPIYAMLMSIYQFNLLIKQHNKLADSDKIKQVKVEVKKSSVPL